MHKNKEMDKAEKSVQRALARLKAAYAAHEPNASPNLFNLQFDNVRRREQLAKTFSSDKFKAKERNKIKRAEENLRKQAEAWHKAAYNSMKNRRVRDNPLWDKINDSARQWHFDLVAPDLSQLAQSHLATNKDSTAPVQLKHQSQQSQQVQELHQSQQSQQVQELDESAKVAATHVGFKRSVDQVELRRLAEALDNVNYVESNSDSLPLGVIAMLKDELQDLYNNATDEKFRSEYMKALRRIATLVVEAQTTLLELRLLDPAPNRAQLIAEAAEVLRETRRHNLPQRRRLELIVSNKTM